MVGASENLRVAVLAIGRATGPLGQEPKGREPVLSATGQRTHLTPLAYILKPCFAAGLFLSRVCALFRAANCVWRRRWRLFVLQSPERVA
jgi:hypothetical protein